MDINKHRYYMTQVLLEIFRDKELGRVLAFKGGTSLLMFHGLTRFSTDLDFNLLDPSQSENVYHRLRILLSKFGAIDDEAMKFFGPVIVLNYEKGERMLKVEVSNRQYDNHYEILSLFGMGIRVMTMPDMFAHKLCALGERITPRDVFDVWFFLKNHTEINPNIIRLRTDMFLVEYLEFCAERVSEMSPKMLMQGLGEVLLDGKSKNFVRKQLIDEVAMNLKIFSMCPLVACQQPTARLKMIDAHPELVTRFHENNIDISMVSEQALVQLLEGQGPIKLLNKGGETIEFLYDGVQ